MSNQEFGGDWTHQKLQILDEYLTAYCNIFQVNKRARFFKTIYVDAFAGTGAIKKRAEPGEDESLATLFAGSATLALKHPFHRYVFIEKSADRVADLQKLKSESGARDRISIHHGDANQALLKFAKSTDWNAHRAVVFLDPYGMQVEWEVIRALGATKAVDLWFLFPLGMAVMRLLMRGSEPPPEWQACLTKIFGTSSWKEEFYITSVQIDFFEGEISTTYRHAHWRAVKNFLIERLKTAFHAVHPKPAVLRNSRNVPIYLFCFAAANPVGARPALRIADHLLKPFEN